MQQYNQREDEKHLGERLEEVKSVLPDNARRGAILATEKGASSWLTVIPLKDMNFTLNKREFRDAVHFRYDWHIADTPSTCICEDTFTVDHAMVCKQGGFIIHRHNELRDLEADFAKHRLPPCASGTHSPGDNGRSADEGYELGTGCPIGCPRSWVLG